MTKYSEDEDSKSRGGDLTFFDKRLDHRPEADRRGGFRAEGGRRRLAARQDGQGLRGPALTQKRPGFKRPLAEVKRQIQQRLFRDPRTKAMDTFVADLKKKTQIAIHEENLAKVVIETGAGAGPAGRRAAAGDARAGVRRAPRPAGPPGMPPHPCRRARSPLRARRCRRRGCARARGGLAVPVAARARVVEKVAAVVGDDIILASEVEEKAAPLLADVSRIADAAKRAARATALRREVLDRLIDDELILQQAAELKLSVTQRAGRRVDRRDQAAEQHRRRPARDALRGQGMSMAAYRADLKKQLLRFRVINIAVGSRVTISDEDVKSYYDRHMKDGGNVQVRASHIFIAIPDGADAAAVAEKQALARSCSSGRAGEDFAKLAREVLRRRGHPRGRRRPRLLRQGHAAQGHRGDGVLR